MSGIGADTNQLRATAAAFRQGSGSLQEAFQQASRAFQGMQESRWAGQHRIQAEEAWLRIHARFDVTVETLTALWVRTERLAEALEEAGRVFGDGVQVSHTPQAGRLLTFDELRAILLQGLGDVGAILLKLASFSSALLFNPAQIWELLGNPGRLTSVLSSDDIATLWNHRDQLGSMLGTLMRNVDAATDQFWAALLPATTPDSRESLHFQIGGDVTIPGATVALPFSPELLAARGASVTRDEDGNYLLTLSDRAGVGANWSALPNADVSVTFGHTTIGDSVGDDAELEASLQGSTQVQYRFRPDTPGDMTKMAVFMGALGLTSAVVPQIPVTACPPLMVFHDNLLSIQVGGLVEGKGSVDVSALVKLAGVEASIAPGAGMGLSRESGQWQASQYVELQGSAAGTLLTTGGGIEATMTLERLDNLETGEQSARVTVALQAEAGKGITLQDLQAYLPQSSLDDIHLQTSTYGNITVEYTLREPVENVQRTLESMLDGSPDLTGLAENSELVVTGAGGYEVSAGLSGNVDAGVGQSIELNVEGSMQRESARTLMRIKAPEEAVME